MLQVSIGTEFGKNFNYNTAPSTIGSFITNILPTIYSILAIFVLMYLIWGAYRYMMSAGDPKEAQAARSQMTWAVAGIIIIFLAYGIYQLTNSLLGNVF